MDECTKSLLHLSQMVAELILTEVIMPLPTTILYNDNNACVCWSQNMTTRGLATSHPNKRKFSSGIGTIRIYNYETHSRGNQLIRHVHERRLRHSENQRYCFMSSKEYFQRHDKVFLQESNSYSREPRGCWIGSLPRSLSLKITKPVYCHYTCNK